MPQSKFSKMNKEEKLEARKNAYRKWSLTKLGHTTPVNLNIIAKEIGMSMNEIEFFMIKDKWNKRLEKDKKNNTTGKEIKKKLTELETDERINDQDADVVQNILDKSDLSERWKLFIMYYLQCYSPTTAALKAGYSKSGAGAAGLSLLKDERIKVVLNQIKAVINKSLYLEAHDVLSEYVKIAFADMTDFVEVKEGRISIKDTDKVDGTLISEIKQGRDGITVKLHDKMKALDKIDKLFDLIPDRKLELDREKFEFQKELADKTGTENKTVTIINDL